MFYYDVDKKVTNITDNQPLKVVGTVIVYTDEAKTEKLTEFSCNELGLTKIYISDCPIDTVENFNNYVDGLFLNAVNQADVQTKLKEVANLKVLGLLD